MANTYNDTSGFYPTYNNMPVPPLTYDMLLNDPPPEPSISAVFNASDHAPGYTITLLMMNQLVDIGVHIEYWNLIRVSPNTMVWPNQVVRGGDFIRQGPSGAGTYVIDDVEAPFLDPALGVWTYRIEVYTTATVHSSQYDFQATIAQLASFVNTSPGQAYVKVIEGIALSRYTFIEDFSAWSRPGSILSENAVLGRKNKVILSDVVRGKEGSFKIFVVTDYGDPAIRSTIFDLEATLETGETLLIQSTNFWTSGFKDLYCKIKDLSFKRGTTFNYAFDSRSVVFEIDVSFVEVDRPDTSVEVSLRTWQQVLDNNASWTLVNSKHPDWLDVLLNPTL